MTEHSARHGTAIATDGSALRFVVVGSGKQYLFMGPATVATFDVAGRAPWIEALGQDFRLIFADYPALSQKTLSPDDVALDYLAVADAAGADHFVYYGYSWGAVTGLQLALRTHRLTALVAGGFAMLGGHYPELLRLCRAMAAGPVRVNGVDMPSSAEISQRQRFVDYYEGLIGFDDRAMQGRLDIPRLNFAGADDIIVLDNEFEVQIGGMVAESMEALRTFGWDVEIMDGLDHWKAAMPEAAVPLVSRWLRLRLSDTANDGRDSTGPMFMSAEHVRIVNELLVHSPETRRACSELLCDELIAYRLNDENDGNVVWWQMRFSRSEGVVFALGQPSIPASVTVECGYWSMLQGVRDRRAGQTPTVDMKLHGDEEALKRVGAAYAAAIAASTIPVVFPTRST